MFQDYLIFLYNIEQLFLPFVGIKPTFNAQNQDFVTECSFSSSDSLLICVRCVHSFKTESPGTSCLRPTFYPHARSYSQCFQYSSLYEIFYPKGCDFLVGWQNVVPPQASDVKQNNKKAISSFNTPNYAKNVHIIVIFKWSRPQIRIACLDFSIKVTLHSKYYELCRKKSIFYSIIMIKSFIYSSFGWRH